MFQPVLFDPDVLFKEPLQKYEKFFSLINLTSLDYSPAVGRKPISHAALTRALIYKNLRSLSALSDLAVELSERPHLAYVLGFPARTCAIPVERFSSFLRTIDNLILQQVRETLVHRLITRKIITGKYLSVDACPIKANVKNNNLKTNVSNRFSKLHPPHGDPDARLGVFPTFPYGQRNIEFFWGYRNHLVNDAGVELPLIECTLGANIRGSSIIVPQLTVVKDRLRLHPKAILADSEYDSATIIEYILHTLRAKPRIARNPRRGPIDQPSLSSSGAPVCIAGFPMVSRGIFWDNRQQRLRHKFFCPIRASKTFAQQHPFCPWFHPQFERGSGCYKLLRVDQDVRHLVDYGSPAFKKDYNRRTSSERIFSRLLTLSMQEPTVRGLRATANLCTIAHITVLAVALFASFVNEPKRIRFVKSFIPNL